MIERATFGWTKVWLKKKTLMENCRQSRAVNCSFLYFSTMFTRPEINSPASIPRVVKLRIVANVRIELLKMRPFAVAPLTRFAFIADVAK